MQLVALVKAPMRVKLEVEVESDVAPELIRQALLDFSDRSLSDVAKAHAEDSP